MTSANHPGPHLGRCGVSHLSEPRLVAVARIFIDADERLEEPVISHHLPLTKNAPRGLRRPPDRRRPGLPNPRLRLLEIRDGRFPAVGCLSIVST